MSFRFRDGSQVNGVPVADAVAAIAAWAALAAQRLADRGVVRGARRVGHAGDA